MIGGGETRILLVEDNAFDRELVHRALRDRATPGDAVRIVDAVDWPAARAALLTGGFDVMLLDHYLPGMSGLDVLRTLQGEPHPPVIVITGQDDVTTAIETMRAGAADYVSKTADWERALPLAMTRVLERERLARELNESRTRLALYVAELEERVAARTAVVQAQAAEIEALYLRLEEASRLRSEIVANVSHELRAPLQTILGCTGERGDARADGLLDTVRTQAEQMRRLVDSLQAVGRLHDGGDALRVAPFSLPAMMRELEAEAAALNGDGRVTFACTAPPEPCEITNDREKIRAIGYHLLTNAMKFTTDGRVDLSALRTADGGVVLTVRDTGSGLPADARAIVFDDGRRSDTSGRRPAGLGFGLGIVKRYTALLRGTVHVHSASGEGCTFVVTLPARPATSVHVDAGV